MTILRRCSKGQFAVLFAIALPALLGVLALTCDMSVMYMNWQRMQKAADAAVLARAGRLNGTDSTGDSKAITVTLSRTVAHLQMRTGGRPALRKRSCSDNGFNQSAGA
jgi:Flp pilus assembly protein TadG